MDNAVLSQQVSAGTEILERPTCRHRWIIDAPSGPSSRGVCNICGAVKQFLNYVEGSSWGYDVSVENLLGGAHIPKGSDSGDVEPGLAEDK